MELFLFIIGNRPGYRRTLHEAQAVLEDHLRDQQGISDVWWDDEEPYWARTYLYGSSHSDTAVDDAPVDFETTDQLIWPITIPALEPKVKTLDPLFPMGAEMVLTVTTMTEKHQVVECVTESEWCKEEFRPYIITHFAAQAGQTLASNWTSKEST